MLARYRGEISYSEIMNMTYRRMREMLDLRLRRNNEEAKAMMKENGNLLNGKK